MITAAPAKEEADAPTLKLPPFVTMLDLAAVPTAVSCARMFMRHTLKRWKFPCLVDSAELIASELVTNAVKATGITTPQPSWGELEDVQLLRVRLHASRDSIVIQVWDVDDKPLDLPTAGADDDDAECGRGLFIVRSIARQVGHFYPRGGGKVVWAELPLEPPVQPLPRRAAKRPASIHLPKPDPDLLRAVLNGLQAL